MTLQNLERDYTILCARWKCTITISAGLPKSSAFTEKRCNVSSDATACLESCLQHRVPISTTCQGQTNPVAESSYGEPLAFLIQMKPSLMTRWYHSHPLALATRGASWREGSRQLVSSASASSYIIGTTRPGTKRHRTSSNTLRCSTTGRDGTRRWATGHRCSFWRIGVWLNTMKIW